MAGEPGFMVIRGISPGRMRLLAAAAVVLLGLLGWGLFALGRTGWGFGITGPLSGPATLRRAIAERDATIADLRLQVAELDTLKAAQERERQEVSQTIGELQAEVARQRQQLDFYRGIVSTTEPPANIAIRSLRIDDAGRSGRRLLRLSLVQPGSPQSTVAGTVRVTLEGARGERPTRSLLFEIPYSFRYFENVERELPVPAGVTPERLLVEIRPAGRAGRPVVQSVLWPP
jgi:hypothetical protein